MTPRLRLAEAATTLAPLQQGALDGLCGIYAVINAIRLAIQPHRKLTRRECRILFDVGIEFLSNTRTLKSAASIGLYEAHWSKLCEHLLEAATRLTGLELTMLRPPARTIRTATETVQLIISHLRRGRPVLLLLEGRLNHLTVVVRYNETRLMLFDSAGHRWILIKSIGLRNRHSPSPYALTRKGIVALVTGYEIPP